MHTVTQTAEVYTFAELSQEAKHTAIEKYGSANDSDWHEFVIDDFKAICATMGLENVKPSFSGFSTQGDGASFTADYSYQKGSVKNLTAYAPQDAELQRIARELATLQRKRFFSVSGNITTSGRYSHEMTMGANLYVNGDYLTDAEDEEFLELFRDLARWLYSTLETEYDYLNSEEAFAEQAEANEYQFTADGKLF